jgi:hypothetical protein
MTTAITTKVMQKISESLKEIREKVLDASRECFRTDNGQGWQEAETLFNFAKSVDALRQEADALSKGTPRTPTTTTPSLPLSTRQTAVKDSEGQRSSKRRKEDYPKYMIRSGCLVKVGLSRDKRTEYEHEVPKSEFDKVVARLSTLASPNKEITVEQVQTGLDCPSYQTYIVIAVLLQMGVLISPWRGAYKFASADKFATDAAAVWNRLPQA